MLGSGHGLHRNSRASDSIAKCSLDRRSAFLWDRHLFGTYDEISFRVFYLLSNFVDLSCKLQLIEKIDVVDCLLAKLVALFIPNDKVLGVFLGFVRVVKTKQFDDLRV